VRLASGEELSAPVVISDAGARATYLKLLGDDVTVPFRDALRDVPRGMAHVSLYLGLSRSPAELGVQGENLWLHDGLDHDDAWRRRRRLLEGDTPNVYVSFPSMKDPAARTHTAELVALADAGDFARWQGTPWKRRGEDYLAAKERVADALLAAAERRLPGLSRLVAFRELSTPLSTEGFTGHAGGEIYGVPFTPARLDAPWIGPRTPVRGLHLAGADALSLGVVGAMMGGVFAAARVAGLRVFPAVKREARRLSAARATRPTPSAPSPSTA
jgi:phytoene dehydrogenase-like protein